MRPTDQAGLAGRQGYDQGYDRRGSSDGHGAGYQVARKQDRDEQTPPRPILDAARFCINTERPANGRRQCRGQACVGV